MVARGLTPGLWGGMYFSNGMDHLPRDWPQNTDIATESQEIFVPYSQKFWIEFSDNVALSSEYNPGDSLPLPDFRTPLRTQMSICCMCLEYVPCCFGTCFLDQCSDLYPYKQRALAGIL
jgi:hypothetical protein